jgi:zinc D-Ala-D-Ala carboxypeptidase
MNLSDNLTLKEVIKSKTAIKHGIDNSPTKLHKVNLKAIAENIFERVREGLGSEPIFVSSGYRSAGLNAVIPGASNTSQHAKGEALDLDNDIFGSPTNAEIFYYIFDNLDYDQLIWEYGDNKNPDWVHVSYKKNGKNRNQALKASWKNGKRQYEYFYDNRKK